MVGSAVAMTVESRFCMNSALATMTAVSRVSCETRLERMLGGLGMSPVSLREPLSESPKDLDLS